jgi:gamma-glutamyltranspeptidase/glutathione hydrolase
MISVKSGRAMHSVQKYLSQGKAPRTGEIFRQPNLAKTWRELGKHGRDYYYSGELARKIVAASDAGGGYLKLPDLAGQHSEWMDPISAIYRGHRVIEMPPNGQGLIVLMALRILEGYDIAGIFRSDLAVAEHLILEALKLSFADAEHYIGDPRFSQVDVEQLLSDAFVASRRGKIRMDEAIPAPTAGRLRGDTTYFTVVDKDRNAVSFITSISDIFGSGIVVGDTGSLCITERRNFLLKPDTQTRSRRGNGRVTASFLLWSFRAMICACALVAWARICSPRVRCRSCST